MSVEIARDAAVICYRIIWNRLRQLDGPHIKLRVYLQLGPLALLVTGILIVL